MIIFGTRDVKSIKGKGEFHCPHCNGKQAYVLKQVKRFFSFLFMPIIPLGKKGEYVDCNNCRATFIPNVLSYDPSHDDHAFLSEYDKAMKHCLVLIMIADDKVDPHEMSIVLNIINKFSHNDINMTELEDYVRDVRRHPQPVGTYLKAVSTSLNNHGKEMIIKSALAVASSDGNINQSEIKVIKHMAITMDMSLTHLKDIFHETMTPTSSL